MLSYERQRQLLIVGILGIILVVILAIVALVLIWRPAPEEKKEFKVGQVDGVSLTEDDMLNEYYTRIRTMLENSNVEGICDLVGEDYYTHTGKTREDIKQMLEDSSMLGKSISLEEGVLYDVDGYNHVYVLDLKSDGEVYAMNIVVREEAPEKYSIAFDKFIDYTENVYAGSANSVELRAIRRVRYTTSVSYRLRITNNYKDVVIINADKSNDAVPFVSSMTQQAKIATMCTIANQSLEIPAGMTREIDVTYNMSRETDYSTYNVLVLNNIQYVGIEGITGLEYYLY